MKFARESYSRELVGEMMPLFEKHYAEIATFKDIPLAPDIAAYERVNAAGNLRIYTARQKDELVGYEVVFVNFSPHYRTSLQANPDLVFIDPRHRVGLTALRFIKWIDEQLKIEGVQVVYGRVKLAHDFSPLLKRLGYVDHDRTLARRLN
jgi:hypothetical protein